MKIIKRAIIIKAYCLLILFIFPSSNCFSLEQVTLFWDANTEESLAGYRIYYNANACCDYEFFQEVPLNEIDEANPEYTVTGLADYVPYYFAVTAIDSEGSESGYSNVVNTRAPNITSYPTVTQISDNTATIEWTTDTPSTSVVRYGTTQSEWGNYTLTETEEALVTQHSITLSGLEFNVKYFFRVGSTNEIGFGPDSYPGSIDNNPSGQDFFTTTEPDTIAPYILRQPYAVIADSYAIIRWTTDEPATSFVEYGKSASYGNSASSSGFQTHHNVQITGLEPNTTYHFRVRSMDTTGLQENITTSDDFIFTTLTMPDTLPPWITSPPTVIATTNTTATIEWETNEPTISRVRYGTTEGVWWSDYTNWIFLSDYAITRIVTLTGLDSDTTYYFRVESRDQANNATPLSREVSFKTESVADTKAPQITSVPTVISKTDVTATIVWDTDEPANSQIRYGTLGNGGWIDYQYSKNDAEMAMHHVMTLTNLSPNTAYYFKVGSTDSEGNGPLAVADDINPSVEISFITDETPDTIAPQIISPPTATAKSFDSITIEWETDESSNSEVWYGEESSTWGNYASHLFNPEGDTFHRVIITGLKRDTKYYFRVGGTDMSNNGPNTSTEDNNPSIEISATTDHGIDMAPPQIISPPTVTAKADTVAVIEWSTDEPSNSLVQYDIVSSTWGGYQWSESDSAMVVNHVVTLTGLTGGTTYYFRVGSVDVNGYGPEDSYEVTFATDATSDETAPVITTPPTVTAITDTTATIEWSTDEPSNSIVKYKLYFENNPLFEWGANARVVNGNMMVTNHSVTLTNLTPQTQYHFRVGSADATGNGPNVDPDEKNNPFTAEVFTTEIEKDILSPKILYIPNVIATDSTSAIIEWETDEPSNSIVKYGEQETADANVGGSIWENLPLTESDAEMKTNHSVTITGLNPSTSYYFRAGSRDAQGNGPELNEDSTNESVLGTFVTAIGPDKTAPNIANAEISFYTNTTALITWETDEPSNSIVRYGGQDGIANSNWGEYELSEEDSGMTKLHSVTITGLQPNTQYYFRVGSIDAKGNGPLTRDDDNNPSIELSFVSSDGPDENAPQIVANSKVVLTSISERSVLVEWVTDEPGNSQVRYDTGSKFWTGYTYSENDMEMVRDHSVLINGLSHSTLYYIRVSSTDASGNNHATDPRDSNPSREYNWTTSEADPPSIIVYPDTDYPKVDLVNDTIDITYDEPNMQNAKSELNYLFSPSLTFVDQENAIRQLTSISTGSTYRLSFVSIPEYTIIAMTVGEGIVDADGNPVQPSTVLINDNDVDDLPDDWEVLNGLNPNSGDETIGEGKEGDFDADGLSNYEEFINGTDPKSLTIDVMPPTIIDVIPHDGSGIENTARIPNNTSVAILISDSAGIDIEDPSNVYFTISDKYNDVYEIDLSRTDVIRVIKLDSEDLDNGVKRLWVVYDRSLDEYSTFPFNTEVDVSVRIANKNDQYAVVQYRFKIETETEHKNSINSDQIPTFSILDSTDSDFEDDFYEYNDGIEITSGELEGTKIIYSVYDDPISPELAPIDELPLFNVPNAYSIGMPINIQPPTIFSVPVKLIIVKPADFNVKDISIYLSNGEEWILGCDTKGNSPIEGWLVPGSRVNGDSTIELKVLHFCGIQTAILGEGTGGGASRDGGIEDQTDEVGSCFVGGLLEFKSINKFGMLAITILLITGCGILSTIKT